MPTSIPRAALSLSGIWKPLPLAWARTAPASCSWPRPSSAPATTPRTLQKNSSTWSAGIASCTPPNSASVSNDVSNEWTGEAWRQRSCAAPGGSPCPTLPAPSQRPGRDPLLIRRLFRPLVERLEERLRILRRFYQSGKGSLGRYHATVEFARAVFVLLDHCA